MNRNRESVVSVEPVRHGLFCAHFHWGVKSSRYNKDDYDRGNGANSIADGKVSHANNASGSAKPSGQPFWASPTSDLVFNKETLVWGREQQTQLPVSGEKPIKFEELTMSSSSTDLFPKSPVPLAKPNPGFINEQASGDSSSQCGKIPVGEVQPSIKTQTPTSRARTSTFGTPINPPWAINTFNSTAQPALVKPTDNPFANFRFSSQVAPSSVVQPAVGSQTLTNTFPFVIQPFTEISTSNHSNTVATTSTKSIKTNLEQELIEYCANFVIERQPYVLSASFIMSNGKILTSLKMTRDDASLNASKTEDNLESDEQLPCAVWANITECDNKLVVLNSKISECHWISDKFDGSFACPPLIPNSLNVILGKPWTCLLWIEFQTFSGSEKNVLRHLKDLYVEQSQCDVEFLLEDGKEVGGHAYLLAARSPVFAAMFKHDMQELKTRQVQIQDIKPDIFKQLLHYIYSGRICEPLSETSAQPLYVAADKYDISDLMKECVRFLFSHIRVDNTISLMVWAHLHSVETLKNAAINFTGQHGKAICSLKDWEELTKNYPELSVLAVRRILECA